MKRPSFQFYPADWKKDAALQSCSLAAQGLWINILCIAHECQPYGHLTVNGKPMLVPQIARLVGVSSRECERLLTELHSSGVAAMADDGSVYSRRMVRDEAIRSARAEGGKAGSEHGVKGAEHGHKGGRPKKVRGVSEPPKEPPPSSSSSSSSSTSVSPGEAVKVCLALKAAGIANVNPSNPRLSMLVEAGATAPEFVAMAAKATGKSDAFSYVLACVEGERKRAAETGGVIHRGELRVIGPPAPASESVEEYQRRVAAERAADQERMAQQSGPAPEVLEKLRGLRGRIIN